MGLGKPVMSVRPSILNVVFESIYAGIDQVVVRQHLSSGLPVSKWRSGQPYFLWLKVAKVMRRSLRGTGFDSLSKLASRRLTRIIGADYRSHWTQ
ncbi:hypothetical protein BK658_16945 [Pseudomonas brassicacearum]|uniref:Uncharacterized protein n=1 Tax=Pseudomonas brassicacearum TaxID=930166 RepID=A0A423GPW3_9PSED|nr:hypothetical protein BK658_16945 [Pseudomonas brassicacearum]